MPVEKINIPIDVKFKKRYPTDEELKKKKKKDADKLKAKIPQNIDDVEGLDYITEG